MKRASESCARSALQFRRNLQSVNDEARKHREKAIQYPGLSSEALIRGSLGMMTPKHFVKIKTMLDALNLSWQKFLFNKIVFYFLVNYLNLKLVF